MLMVSLDNIHTDNIIHCICTSGWWDIENWKLYKNKSTKHTQANNVRNISNRFVLMDSWWIFYVKTIFIIMVCVLMLWGYRYFLFRRFVFSIKSCALVSAFIGSLLVTNRKDYINFKILNWIAWSLMSIILTQSKRELFVRKGKKENTGKKSRDFIQS